MFDAIVIGARCAGSPTAMLLARKGYRVLLLDRATFPSDVVNGYYLQQPGGALLNRWGLLSKLVESNCPPVDKLSFDFGDFTLTGSAPGSAGITSGYAPRRTVLDKILVDAAVTAGAELREGFIAEELLWSSGRVTGVRGRAKSGASVSEQARIVIGADGTNSMVARAVEAPVYNTQPTLTCWYYAHFSGVTVDGLEFYLRKCRTLIACYTNDRLTFVGVGAPYSEFVEFRKDVEGNFWSALDLVPEVAQRVRNGKREERFVGTVDTANFFRKPYGAGWALVGDAGYHKDPSTAQGMSDSFHYAEMVANAIDDGFSGRQSLDESLADYEQRRNSIAAPMYGFTQQLSNLEAPPAPEIMRVLSALAGNQADTNRFFGTWAGTIPIPEFFARENLARIMTAAEKRQGT
jgi:flavin-dependent dehydrogenase